LFGFAAPARAVSQQQFNAAFSAAKCLKQHKTDHTEKSAIQDESEKNADHMNNRVLVVLRAWMDGNLYKPAVCFFVALTARFRKVVFMNAGLIIVFFIDIMQGAGGMAANAIGCFLGAQPHQLTVYGLIIGVHRI
jgi:hypothetical protein